MATKAELIEMTADVVAAYVGANTVAAGELPGLIRTVHAALNDLSSGVPAEAASAPQPAVPVKKSVQPDHIVCLEDGRKFKSLKRHLRSQYGMTPDEYRAKWGLPSDYPMVAPSYARARSDLAKQLGLGRKSGKSAG